MEQTMQEHNTTYANTSIQSTRNRKWRISWQEGTYRQTLSFEADSPQKAVDLFQAWLHLHGMAIPAQVQFEVIL